MKIRTKNATIFFTSSLGFLLAFLLAEVGTKQDFFINKRKDIYLGN